MAWKAVDRIQPVVDPEAAPLLSESLKEKIRSFFPRYETKRAVLLPALHIVQHQFGHVSYPVMKEVAELLEIHPSDVMDVVSFYTHFSSHPKGTKTIVVCRSLSCELLGGKELLDTLKEELGVEDHGTTADGKYTLMTEDFGPLDWRNAFAHSLYWSSWGDHYTEGQIGGSRADAMNTARFVFFSLQNLTTRGKMTLWPDFDDPFSSYLELTPDTRYIPYIYETYLRLGKKHFGDDPRFVEGTAGPNYAKGMVTNAHNWIELLYLEGGEENLEQAENYLAWLRKTNPHPDGSTQERYLVTLDEFVMGDLLAQLQTFRAAKGIIGSFIRKSLKNFALGLTEQGRASFIHAVQSYEYWMEDTKIDFNDRRKLQPPLLQLRDQIESFMKVPQYATLAKARLWNNLPLQQRQMTYDRLLPLFERLCSGQQPPWSRQRAFPEPAGMEEARKRSYDFRGKRREDVEQGERYKK
ncbi:MAG: NAD(P)H-dependent oxidoreductase subunit E [Planctomycetes bacterium]|nr:NAD(P)H-dependent oxidoreductase subunit E [Planctomycetota bacterium]